MEKNQVMEMMNCDIGDNLNLKSLNTATAGLTYQTSNSTGNLSTTAFGNNMYSCWDYWHKDYYPQVIRESYPIYIRERAEDKGKQAYEIIKILKDKKLVNLEKVSDFIDLMDELIKIL